MQWGDPKNASLVREALIKCGRSELIGYGKSCLVKPESNSGSRNKMNGRSVSAAKSKRVKNESDEKKPFSYGKGWAKPKKRK